MRKGTLFISAALTTFMLAVLFGVASAYQKVVNSSETAAAATVQVQPTAGAEMISDSFAPVVVPTQVENLTPEAAADFAAKVLGRTDLFSVGITQFEGADVYLVTFSSGDLVYISLDGKILSISKLPVTIIAQPKNSGSGGGSGGNHEDHHEDEHEDEHDD